MNRSCEVAVWIAVGAVLFAGCGAKSTTGPGQSEDAGASADDSKMSDGAVSPVVAEAGLDSMAASADGDSTDGPSLADTDIDSGLNPAVDAPLDATVTVDAAFDGDATDSAAEPSADCGQGAGGDSDASPVGYPCPGPDKPAAGAVVPGPPKPDMPTCSWQPPALFKGATPPPPTLQVQTGAADASGAFVPYQDGDWLGMFHGVQGGFHINVGLRVVVPGLTVDKAKVQMEVRTYDGCSLVGYSLAPVVYPLQQPDGSYVFGTLESPGVQGIFVNDCKEGLKGTASKDFCNRWFLLRVAVRELSTGLWGEQALRFRTFDVSNKGS